MCTLETPLDETPQDDRPGKPTCLVDADACPVRVRQAIEKLARRYGLRLIYFVDENHELYPGYGEVRQIAQGHDAVDYALLGQVRSGDVVVTQDYGLASLVLAKRGHAIHPSGNRYDHNNIDHLLMERHLASRARRAGERPQRSRRPSGDQKISFEKQLNLLLGQIIQRPERSD